MFRFAAAELLRGRFEIHAAETETEHRLCVVIAAAVGTLDAITVELRLGESTDSLSAIDVI